MQATITSAGQSENVPAAVRESAPECGIVNPLSGLRSYSPPRLFCDEDTPQTNPPDGAIRRSFRLGRRNWDQNAFRRIGEWLNHLNKQRRFRRDRDYRRNGLREAGGATRRPDAST